jgi:hypothetical protein
MVSGLIASQHVSLGKIADHQPGKIYSLSQVKKNERWLDNDLIDATTFFTPLIIKIIHGIILQEKEGSSSSLENHSSSQRAFPRIRPFTVVETLRRYLKTTS